jgi:hypothetical protein
MVRIFIVKVKRFFKILVYFIRFGDVAYATYQAGYDDGWHESAEWYLF